MKKTLGYGTKNDAWKKTMLGIGIGMIVMLATAGAFAWLIQREIMGTEHMGLGAAAVLLLGSFSGTACSGRGEGSLVRAVVVSTGLIMVLLLINLMLCDGKLKGLLPGAVAVAGGASASVLIRAGDSRNGRKHRYRKYTNR